MSVPRGCELFAGEQNRILNQPTKFLFRGALMDTRFGEKIRNDFVFHRQPFQARDADVVLTELPCLTLAQFHFSILHGGNKLSSLTF